MPTTSTLEHWESVLEEASTTPQARAAASAKKSGKKKAGLAYTLLSPRERAQFENADGTGGGAGMGFSVHSGAATIGSTSSSAAAVAGTTDGANKLPAMSRATVEEITNAWQEAAHAAEEERNAIEEKLKALQAEHAQALEAQQQLERKLESTEVSMEAYMEAAHAAGDAAKAELSAALERANARAEARTRQLESKADMATRDVASLRAHKILNDVHATTLGLELGLPEVLVWRQPFPGSCAAERLWGT